MTVIYKLTREDGLEYIGVTTNLVKRLNKHKHSRRFSEYPIQKYEILFEGSYEECDELEEQYIKQFDTFKNGLNMTERGKGKNKSNKFNTYGYKFSEESRRKMSARHNSKRNYGRGYKHSEETKLAWSKQRRTISREILLDKWQSFNPTTEELLKMSGGRYEDGSYYYKNNVKTNYFDMKLHVFSNLFKEELGHSISGIKKVIKNEFNAQL